GEPPVPARRLGRARGHRRRRDVGPGLAALSRKGRQAGFRLRVPEAQLRFWADRYSYPSEEDIEKRVAPSARDRGYLQRDEFLELCRWKTPRSQPRCETNSEELIREVTRTALG